MSICRVLLACLVSFNCVFFLTNHKKSITNLIKKNVIERRKKKEHCSNPLTVIPPRKKISFSVSCNCNIIRNQFINLIKKMIFKKKKEYCSNPFIVTAPKSFSVSYDYNYNYIRTNL